MAPLPNIDVNATRHQHQQENKRQKKSGGSARTLMHWLESSEVDADIPNILKALEDNQDDLNQLLNCCKVVIKFANKAVKINQWEEWLEATKQVIQNIDQEISSELLKAENIPFTDLYITKFSCIEIRNNYNQEAEDYLHKAISLSGTNEEKIKANLMLAQYYENISEYDRMKNCLNECNKLCQTEPLFENYLAHIWLLIGHYYFFQFSFSRSRKNLIKAKNKLELILNKTQNKTQESEWTHRRLSDCLHYIGRTYHEEYKLVKAAEYYIKSQHILEENHQKNLLTEEQGATAFYHLRLGQILEICQIRDSARNHYSKSLEIFTEYRVSKSGLAQVNLAVSNIIKDDSTAQSQSYKSTLNKQESQIKQAAKDSLDTGYYRGYLLALLQLFWLYLRNGKLHLALPLVWKALTSDEFQKSGGILLLYRYAQKFIFGIFYRIRFLVWLKLHSHKVLYRCPCPIHQNQEYDK